MIINAKDMTDEDWKEEREANKVFLDHALKRINERINETAEINGGIFGSELDAIVREELGLDLHNYDVDFMMMYIDHNDEFEDD